MKLDVLLFLKTPYWKKQNQSSLAIQRYPMRCKTYPWFAFFTSTYHNCQSCYLSNRSYLTVNDMSSTSSSQNASDRLTMRRNTSYGNLPDNNQSEAKVLIIYTGGTIGIDCYWIFKRVLVKYFNVIHFFLTGMMRNEHNGEWDDKSIIFVRCSLHYFY